MAGRPLLSWMERAAIVGRAKTWVSRNTKNGCFYVIRDWGPLGELPLGYEVCVHSVAQNPTRGIPVGWALFKDHDTGEEALEAVKAIAHDTAINMGDRHYDTFKGVSYEA